MQLDTDLKDYHKFKAGIGYCILKPNVVPHLNIPKSIKIFSFC